MHHLPKPIVARYIRFLPTNRHKHNCLRVELYGTKGDLWLIKEGNHDSWSRPKNSKILTTKYLTIRILHWFYSYLVLFQNKLQVSRSQVLQSFWSALMRTKFWVEESEKNENHIWLVDKNVFIIRKLLCQSKNLWGHWFDFDSSFVQELKWWGKKFILI